MVEVKNGEIYFNGCQIPLSPEARARRSLEEWEWSSKWRALIYGDPHIFEIIDVDTGKLWVGADFLLQKRKIHDPYWLYPRKPLPFEVNQVGHVLMMGAHQLDLDLESKAVISRFFEEDRFIVLVRDRADGINGSQIIAFSPKGERLWAYSNNGIVLMYWNEVRKTIIADISETELIEIDPQNGKLLGPSQGIF